MSDNTGVAKVPGSKSSASESEGIERKYTDGAAHSTLQDTTQSGTTAERDVAFPSLTGGEQWDVVDATSDFNGLRIFYDAAIASWRKTPEFPFVVANSAAMLALTEMQPEDKCLLLDSGDIYEYHGSTVGWDKTHSGGKTLTVPDWANQLFAQDRYTDTVGAAGTNDNDVIYASGDVSGYNYHIIEATAGTVSIDITIDGTNWIADVAVTDIVTTTPATRVVTLASGSVGILEGKFKNIRILQSGDTASNARVAHGWA